MALAKLCSRAQLGMDAPQVTVEVHLGGGLPSFSLVGLPETSVRESRERVRAALQNSGFTFPASRIIVNLAPADLPKQGGRFDLAIALGILTASGQIPNTTISSYEIYGELSLSGEVRSVRGLLPAIVNAQKAGKSVILPYDNHCDADLIQPADTHLVTSLLDTVSILLGQPSAYISPSNKNDHPPVLENETSGLNQIIGQEQAKRALIIAAAGGHNLLLLGPPGTGKTMLASRLPHLLPPLEIEHALEVASVYSVAGLQRENHLLTQRPFRSPHHSSSAASLVGGGSIPQPGEISLAHRGVLFLDELPEFNRTTLDCLREPLESGEVVISRAAAKLTFPANVQLVAAMNPSPCGNADEHARATPDQILRYLSRLSGPFLDRFDLSVNVPKLPPGLLSQNHGKSSVQGPNLATLRKDILATQQTGIARQGVLNSELAGHQLDQTLGISAEVAEFTEQAVYKLKLSVRAYHRILKVGRTIADITQSETVTQSHITEAIGYRAMDRLLTQLAGKTQY